MSDQLAINGGPKTAGAPFPAWPWYTEEIIQAAMEPLRSGKINYWTGPLGMKFEQAFADWCGAQYGISTSNGTSALHVALAGIGIGPGDEVIVPSYTFIASSFSVCQAGAVPVFADVEPHGHTISAEAIESKISDHTRAILVVHLYGEMCDMDAICALAKKHNLKVVEDCAQAHGGMCHGKKAGTIGDIGAFSFCQSKHFSTGGEGGCVVTDDEDAAWICRSFRDHGYDVKQRLSLLELESKLPYIHNMVGFNFRMTEMQSAIGLKELERLDHWNLANRRRNGHLLNDLLANCPAILRLPLDTEARQNAYWLYPIVMDTAALTVDLKQFTAALNAEGLPAGPVLWPQCYKEKAFVDHNGFGKLKYPFEDPATRPEAVNYAAEYCPNAAQVEKECFWVPTHPTYEPEHMELIAEGIRKVAENYTS